nr:tetratricopeptide repeat protein [uncultured Clostridium sp.]
MKIPKLSMILSIFLLIAVLSSCSSPARPLTSEELLDLGEKYLLELNYEEAVMQFTKLIEIEPKNPRGYLGAAEAYIALGESDKAVAALEEGLEQLPENQEIKAMLGKLTESDTTDVESNQETEQMNETMGDSVPENVAIIIDDIKNALKNESLWQMAGEFAKNEELVTFLEEQFGEYYTYSVISDVDMISMRVEDGEICVDYAFGEKNDSDEFINGFLYSIDYSREDVYFGKKGYSVKKIEIADGKREGVFRSITFLNGGNVDSEAIGKVENGYFSGTSTYYTEGSVAYITKWTDGYADWDTDHDYLYSDIQIGSEYWLAQ